MSRTDLIAFINTNINSKLAADYLSYETLFCPYKNPISVGINGNNGSNSVQNLYSNSSTSTTPSSSSSSSSSSPLQNPLLSSSSVSFSYMQSAYLRARELNKSTDRFLRIAW